MEVRFFHERQMYEDRGWRAIGKGVFVISCFVCMSCHTCYFQVRRRQQPPLNYMHAVSDLSFVFCALFLVFTNHLVSRDHAGHADRCVLQVLN